MSKLSGRPRGTRGRPFCEILSEGETTRDASMPTPVHEQPSRSCPSTIKAIRCLPPPSYSGCWNSAANMRPAICTCSRQPRAWNCGSGSTACSTQQGAFPPAVTPNVVARLKVLAELLTYRTDVPQEGRYPCRRSGWGNAGEHDFPTLYGERAVVRFFARSGRYECLDDLGLPDDVLVPLRRLLAETSGAMTGPAGSGKTTTVYACLRTGGRGRFPRSRYRSRTLSRSPCRAWPSHG